jgi:hypothetical protein
LGPDTSKVSRKTHLGKGFYTIPTESLGDA